MEISAYDGDNLVELACVPSFTPRVTTMWVCSSIMPEVICLPVASIVAVGEGDDENRDYRCWLVKLSPDGCIDTIYCRTTTGVEELVAEIGDAVSIFPNPATERLYLRGEILTEVRWVGVMNMHGREVLQREGFPASGLDTSGLPPRLYLLALDQASGRRWTAKFRKE